VHATCDKIPASASVPVTSPFDQSKAPAPCCVSFGGALVGSPLMVPPASWRSTSAISTPPCTSSVEPEPTMTVPVPSLPLRRMAAPSGNVTVPFCSVSVVDGATATLPLESDNDPASETDDPDPVWTVSAHTVPVTPVIDDPAGMNTAESAAGT